MSGTEDVAAAVPGPLMFGPLMSGTVEEGAAPSESAAAVAAGALYPALAIILVFRPVCRLYEYDCSKPGTRRIENRVRACY